MLSGVAERSENDNQISLNTLINSSLRSESLASDKVGLTVTSGALESASEMVTSQDLISAFSSNNIHSCAITGGYGSLVSVIKAVWCLHNRVIPGSPEWLTPQDLQGWETSAFYVPRESRTWFTSASQPDRVALIINADQLGPSSVFLIQEGESEGVKINSVLQQEPFYLFPAKGSTLFELMRGMESLKGKLSDSTDLGEFSNENLRLFQTELKPDDLVACILGHTREEASREIDFALKGIPIAVEKKSDWRTPLGSYMTPEPLGRSGLVSFVYPGAFNSYPGVARDLFFLFPALYDRLSQISNNLSDLLNERMLYPRSISALTNSDLEEAEKKLSDDPLAMLISGTCLAAVFTFLLRDSFWNSPGLSIRLQFG